MHIEGVGVVKKCPFCAEMVRDEAIKCPHCRSDLTAGAPEPVVPEQAPLPRAVFRSANDLAGWAMGFLFLAMALALLLLAFGINHVLVNEARHGFAGPQSAADSAEALGTTVGFSVLALPLVGLAWLLWQFRSHSNLRVMKLRGLRYSPGWAVWWWFVPGAFIVMPYLTMRELWMASDPEAGSADWKLSRTTPILLVWWLSFLAWTIGWFVVAGIGGNDIQTPAVAVTQGWFAIADGAIGALAAGLGVLLIRRIGLRLGAKHGRHPFGFSSSDRADEPGADHGPPALQPIPVPPPPMVSGQDDGPRY